MESIIGNIIDSEKIFTKCSENIVSSCSEQYSEDHQNTLNTINSLQDRINSFAIIIRQVKLAINKKISKKSNKKPTVSGSATPYNSPNNISRNARVRVPKSLEMVVFDHNTKYASVQYYVNEFINNHCTIMPLDNTYDNDHMIKVSDLIDKLSSIYPEQSSIFTNRAIHACIGNYNHDLADHFHKISKVRKYNGVHYTYIKFNDAMPKKTTTIVKRIVKSIKGTVKNVARKIKSKCEIRATASSSVGSSSNVSACSSSSSPTILSSSSPIVSSSNVSAYSSSNVSTCSSSSSPVILSSSSLVVSPSSVSTSSSSNNASVETSIITPDDTFDVSSVDESTVPSDDESTVSNDDESMVSNDEFTVSSDNESAITDDEFVVSNNGSMVLSDSKTMALDDVFPEESNISSTMPIINESDMSSNLVPKDTALIDSADVKSCVSFQNSTTIAPAVVPSMDSSKTSSNASPSTIASSKQSAIKSPIALPKRPTITSYESPLPMSPIVSSKQTTTPLSSTSNNEPVPPPYFMRNTFVRKEYKWLPPDFSQGGASVSNNISTGSSISKFSTNNSSATSSSNGKFSTNNSTSSTTSRSPTTNDNKKIDVGYKNMYIAKCIGDIMDIIHNQYTIDQELIDAISAFFNITNDYDRCHLIIKNIANGVTDHIYDSIDDDIFVYSELIQKVPQTQGEFAHDMLKANLEINLKRFSERFQNGNICNIHCIVDKDNNIIKGKAPEYTSPKHSGKGKKHRGKGQKRGKKGHKKNGKK